MMKATAVAGSNIAFVKYWGQADLELNVPANDSISMTLDNATTTTTVAFGGDLDADVFELNGRPAGKEAWARTSRHLDRIRQRAGVNLFARVASRNSFPTGTGIASSASGFAALTVAASSALGLATSAVELSRLARLASGSACRSLFGGYVEWRAGTGDADSYATQLAPPAHWRVIDVIAVVSDEPKEVASQAGHRLAPSSPFFRARLEHLPHTVAACRAAIQGRDWQALGEVAEADALSLHAIAMTSRPAVLYWEPATVWLLREILRWREAGLQAYFTLDAGPNVHILIQPEDVAAVLGKLRDMPEVRQTIVCGPGEGPRLLDSHSF